MEKKKERDERKEGKEIRKVLLVEEGATHTAPSSMVETTPRRTKEICRDRQLVTT